MGTQGPFPSGENKHNPLGFSFPGPRLQRRYTSALRLGQGQPPEGLIWSEAGDGSLPGLRNDLTPLRANN